MNRKQRRAARQEDWTDNDEFRSWAKDVLKDMVPKMAGSAYVISIAPPRGLADVKIAVEIGYAILLDKPLIVFAPKGRHVAERLLRIADHVITGDPNTTEGREEMFAQLKRAMNQ
jgi:nucleoside 2-deoxyribosyltransferase